MTGIDALTLTLSQRERVQTIEPDSVNFIIIPASIFKMLFSLCLCVFASRLLLLTEKLRIDHVDKSLCLGTEKLATAHNNAIGTLGNVFIHGHFGQVFIAG